MATHSSTLALKIPWMEELGAGYYPQGRKESDTTSLSLSLSGSFPMSQFFTLGGQSIGVSTSASVLPMNIQD